MEPTDPPIQGLFFAAVPQWLPPPPRRIRRRPGQRGLLGHVPLTVRLLCLAGLALLAWAGWLLGSVWIVLLLGVTVDGDITSKSPIRPKGPQARRVQFTYFVKGEEYSSEDMVDEGTFDWLQPGTPVKVRVLRAWPTHGLLAEPAGQAGNGTGFFLWFAILCNVGLGILVWRCLREPLRQRALVRAGVATPGVIVAKEMGEGWRSSPGVQYSYRAPRHGVGHADEDGANLVTKEWQVLMRVSPSDFEAAQVGAAVTVLYDPRQPSSSLIYSFAPYEVVDPVVSI